MFGAEGSKVPAGADRRPSRSTGRHRHHEPVTATALALPLELAPEHHEVDALMAHAVRLALWPERSVDEAAAELCAAAGGRDALLRAAIARIDRALAIEWSRAGSLALTELEAARARLAQV